MYYHITNKPFFACDEVNILPVFYLSSTITTKIVDIFEKFFRSLEKNNPIPSEKSSTVDLSISLFGR